MLYLCYEEFASSSHLFFAFHTFGKKTCLFSFFFLSDTLTLSGFFLLYALALCSFFLFNALLFFFFALSLLFDESAPLGSLLLHELVLCELLYEDFAYLYVRQVIILCKLLNDFLDELRLEAVLLFLERGRGSSVLIPFEVTFEHKIIK